MLGNIVERKFRRRSRKKSQGHNKSASAAKNLVLPKTEQDHKITEYFPVRRSNRRTAKEIEDSNMKMIYQLVKTGCNEDYLEIYTCETKGRGIRSLKEFSKGEFVVEYKGDLISSKMAQLREEEYSKDEGIGSYMYYFKHRDREYCVDATKETMFKGRLINHSFLRPNLKTRVIEFPTSFHLILIAKRDIDIGEELLYDYGERRPEIIAKNPWLINS